MRRNTRGSKATRTNKMPIKGKTDPPINELRIEPRRKSLRSSARAPSPTSSKVQTESSPQIASSVATRSGRKRFSVSIEEEEEQKSTLQNERDSKRRRTSILSQSSPENRQVVHSTTSGSGRKRRGVQKESPTSASPSAPATKKAKIAPPAILEMLNPVPSSSKTRSTAALKRRHNQESSSESEANQSEQEDDKKSVRSQGSDASFRRRGNKRNRKAQKRHSPVKKAVVLTKKKSTPSKASSKVKKEEIALTAHESENGDKEHPEADSIIEEKFVQPKPKNREPVQSPLTKAEIEVLQRRKLLARLNHDDLSDLINPSHLLNNWPAVELRSQVTPSSALLAFPASHRLWTSEEANILPTNPLTLNGDRHDQLLCTKEVAEFEAPSAKRARRGISPKNNGNGGKGEFQSEKFSDLEANTEIDQHSRVLATFCVASFTISTTNDEATGGSAAELTRLIEEVIDISPDVFCVKQMSGNSAAAHLKSELSGQGYQCSACTDGSKQMIPLHSFIFFNRDVFTEVSIHRRSVQSMARKLVERSAYPQLWRDTLNESLMSNQGTTDNGNQSQLLVTVLRHILTGSLLLFGCLTDRYQAENRDLFHAPVAQTSDVGTKNVSIPNVGGASCCTPTVTVSVAGCNSSKSVNSAEVSFSEWCPRTAGSRPDLAAINAAGCIWALKDVWDEVQDSIQPLLNGGINGVSHSSAPTLRWVLCANLEASPTSPVYQIFRDGYPSDESITRLRAIRNVHLKDHDFFDATTLLDRLWHAFQHTCTDVCSCYQSVMGIEPPFTRYNTAPSSATGDKASTIGAELQKCVDYIFCSGSSLHPRQVLIPPCRAILASMGSCSSSGQAQEIIFSLASKIGIVEIGQDLQITAESKAIL